MGFFEDVVGKIFGKQPPKAAFVHEMLRRSTKELASYQSWLGGEGQKQLFHDIQHAYYMKKQGILSSIDVHILDTQYSNGFAVSFNPSIGHENFRNLFDFFKEKVLDSGYKLSQGDRRVLDKETHEETIEKWYLKPVTEELGQPIINQRYGNVLIEKVDVNRKPSFIKFMANIYQDRQYTKAEPFQDLFDKVFES